MTTAADERPIFSITLRPHRSLSRRGFWLVMGLFCGLLMIPGVLFYTIGAWPVIGFMGLDILLLAGAFRLNNLAAERAQEIRLTRSELTVRETSRSGGARETTFNPYWVRLEVVRREDIGIVRMAFTSHGVRVDIGRFLPLPEREPVATALTNALAEARAG